jgi:hypothetical protein
MLKGLKIKGIKLNEKSLIQETAYIKIRGLDLKKD